jgi:hypothetical protein
MKFGIKPLNDSIQNDKTIISEQIIITILLTEIESSILLSDIVGQTQTTKTVTKLTTKSGTIKLLKMNTYLNIQKITGRNI